MFSVPSGAPENVTTEAMSSTSVLVTWGLVPEHQKNGHILGYKVRLLYQRECFKTLKIPHRLSWRVLSAETLQLGEFVLYIVTSKWNNFKLLV